MSTDSTTARAPAISQACTDGSTSAVAPHVVNFSQRLMMEFIVPEPAAFFKLAESPQVLSGVTAVKPEEPRIWGQPLRPDHLTATDRRQFVSRYYVSNVRPYPGTDGSCRSSVRGGPQPR